VGVLRRIGGCGPQDNHARVNPSACPSVLGQVGWTRLGIVSRARHQGDPVAVGSSVSTLAELARSRELLTNLTLRDVRSRYKRTALGNLWSLINPLAAMLIYTIVFGVLLKVTPDRGEPSGLHIFALWLLCALLPWNFFAIGMAAGMNSLVVNSSLVLKVYLPRASLVVSAVLAVGVTFLIELVVLVVVLVLFGGNPVVWLPLVVVMVVLLACFTLGLALLLSVANVYFRDTQHLVAILLQMWFYLTPILYPVSYVQAQQDRMHANGSDFPLVALFKLNPMEHFVAVFRNLLYDNRWPSTADLAVCAITGIAALVAGLVLFGRYEGRLAEEL
jgi:lipopolysaccharide transport system permease protein